MNINTRKGKTRQLNTKQDKSNKWYIKLHSKYTGEEITLGSSYNTYEEAEEFAKKQCCERCNSYSIHFIPVDYLWLNKEIGFVSKEYLKNNEVNENEIKDK